MCREISGKKKHVEMAELARRKKLAGVQERNHFNGATRDGAWLSDVPHHLNGTELSRKEFRDNLRLRYGLMPQDISATCDGCGKRFLIEHALSCQKGRLVIAQHDNAAKEWGTL